MFYWHKVVYLCRKAPRVSYGAEEEARDWLQGICSFPVVDFEFKLDHVVMLLFVGENADQKDWQGWS